MSFIFEGDLDAFKLNTFQPNFKLSFLRAYADHLKCHQGHKPQSGMSIIIIDSSINSSNVIHLWEGSGWLEPDFKISFLLILKLSIWMSNLKFSQLVLYLMFDQLFDWKLDPQFDWLSVNWLGNVQPNFIDTFEISLKSFPKLSKFHLINASKNTLELGPPKANLSFFYSLAQHIGSGSENCC